VLVLSQQIGPRPAGSTNFARTVDYVATQLSRLGYAVERETFPVSYFEESHPPLLSVVGPTPLELHPLTLIYSASTPRQGVEELIEPIGLAHAEDVQGHHLQGRIALIARGQLYLRDKVANAAAAGASAAIIYNNQPGPVQLGTLIEPAKIPAVFISQDEGQRLLDGLRLGPIRVKLVVTTSVERRNSQNVIGVKLGNRSPTEIVVVGAHADSVKVSPGANDNGSGLAALLEAARLLARVQTARTINVVAFGAEENGLVGSHLYTLSHGRMVVGMVNMDMVGRGAGLQIGNEGTNVSAVDLAERVARRLGLQVRRFKLGQSDHVSFEQASVPAVFITSGSDDAIHTPGDVADRLDKTLIAQAETLAAATAYEMATTAWERLINYLPYGSVVHRSMELT
jgi:aminopeptidase YwaD